MSQLVLTDARIFFERYDMSGFLNAVALDVAADRKDATTFALGVRKYAGGLKSAMVQCEGLWGDEAQSVPDSVFYGFVGQPGTPLSIAPSPAEGSVAYALAAEESAYRLGGDVGELVAFTINAEASSSPLVRGTLVLNSQKLGNGSGTGYVLGALPADKRIYAALHVYQYAGGGSLSMRLESGASLVFGTTRIAFDALAAPGTQWASVAGPLTDDSWRADWTFTGTSFTAAIVVGIH